MLALPIIAGLMFVNACQEKESDQAELNSPPSLKMNEVDQPPQFEACADLTEKDAQINCFGQQLMAHIGQNFQYPKTGKEEGLSGKVYVEFTLTSRGAITGVELRKGLESASPGAEAIHNEALRVVESLPKVKPAKKDGSPVNVSYTVPIQLAL